MAEEDRVIARVGDREIRYAEVWTSRELVTANPKSLRGRNVEEVCVEAEREKFRQLVANEIIEQACAREDCLPDDAEIDRFRTPILKDESRLRELAAVSRRVPEAVRRVYLGEPIEAVYEEVIEPIGRRSLDLFRREVAIYGSLERVERYLAAMIERLGIRILDARFALPSGREAFL